MATRYAGQRIARAEDARLLTGAGTYVDDVQRPRMLHACFVRSPFPRAAIRGIDASEALALDGVHAVLTAADLNPDVREQWFTMLGRNMPTTPLPPLAEAEARFVGDHVALVLAESRYVAEDAAELVEVDWEPLPPVVDYRAAQDTDASVHDGYAANVVGRLAFRPPDEEAFAAAAHVARETISQQAYAAVPMECRGIVAEWTAASGELTIWSATQAPHEVRAYCARLLGLPEARVRVIMRDTGGGFGQKVNVTREEMAIVLAARKVPAAIKWIEDRRENLMCAGQARHETGDCRFAFAADGTIVAAHVDHLIDVGAYPIPWPVGTGAAAGMLFPGPYRVPAATFSTTCVFTNTVGRTAYRGPWQYETLAREVLLDLAARDMGIDPVALRRRNLLRADELPFANPNGMTYDAVTPLETFEHALEILDYDGFRREQAEARAAGRFVGVGTASYVEPTASGMGSFATEGAVIRVEPGGTVNVYVAGGSAGNSVETTVLQLTADALGCDIADVHTVQGDTAVTPYGAGTAGSRSGSMTAGAVAEAARELREKIVAIAAHRLEAAPDDIELEASAAFVRGTPAVSVSLAEIADLAYYQAATLPAGLGGGLESAGRYTTTHGSIWANATHVCTCEVDVVTGEVTILRYIVSEDCGPMINPNVVEGQIAGGTVQGIGGVLYEHLAYDADGNPVTTTFLDYLVPTAAEAPRIEFGHVESMAPGPGGYKGVGEGGAIGAPPAVVNAIADALAPLGVRITELPLGPSRIVALVGAAEPEASTRPPVR
ncbi:MAG: xanthine dehydrogenase family protein [Actinobacteria bacterium]|nr:xanthine dehydrogenase family protein [Actinomycetota bacterium]